MDKWKYTGRILAIVAVAGLAACGGSSDADSVQAPVSAVGLGDAQPSSTQSGGDGVSAGQDTSTTDGGSATDDMPTQTLPESPTDLTVTLPEEAPDAAGFTVTSEGQGEVVEAGDLVYLAWEMYAYETGEVVESTQRDFGGPIPMLLGAGATPAAFENAVIGQKVGSRIEVEFPAGMADLPAQFDATQAHLLSVEIIQLAEDEPDVSPPESTTSVPVDSSTQTTTPRPTTTTPGTAPPAPGEMVSATGPLAATPPDGAPLPQRNEHTVVRAGDGALLQEGDLVRLDYVMVSWTTGEVVLSTEAEFGGPQSLVLGDLEVPRYLESAVFREPVGSRLQVIYSPDLLDLPEGLSRTDAYLLAVDIVGIG